MITCADNEELESIVSSLQKEHRALTVHRGVVHNFLGMRSQHAEICARDPRGERCDW